VSLNDHNPINFKLHIMFKNILKLNGALELSKKEQSQISGGVGVCPQLGFQCFLGGLSPINCLTSIRLACCNGVWVDASNPFNPPC
jgi:hypothetical protein